MSAYAFLLDIFRGVRGVLRPENGGTGSTYGEERVVVRGLNSTGADIELYSAVQLTAGTNAPKISKVTATASQKVAGVCVGYYVGSGELVEADCPDGYEIAVQTAGIVPVLIESAVTRDEYAYSAATDGQADSSSSLTAGAFGRFVDSADVSTGATTARVYLGVLAGFGAGSTSFGTPGLTLSTTNAGGAASTAIRTDATIAAFDSTVPVTQAMGDAAATGSTAKAARRDHVHGMPALGTTAQAIGTSAGGSATTPSKSDHVHATGAGTPSTQAIGDAAAVGSGPAAAMTNHVHGMPAFATPAIVLGSAAAAGAAATLIRSDSTIAAFDATAPTTQDFADAAATGSAAVAARRDHKHGWPSLGTTHAKAAFGDHTHGGSGGTQPIFFPDYPPVSAGGIDDEFNDNAIGGAWTQFDPGSAFTFAEDKYGLSIARASSNAKWAAVYQAIPAGDWAVITKVTLSCEVPAAAQEFDAGILLFEGTPPGATSDFYALALRTIVATGEQRGVSVARWSDYQTFLSNNFATESGSQGMYSSMYLRVRKSGTTYFFEWSSDGLGWTEITNFIPAITIAQVGLGVWAGSTRTVKGYFRFFRQVTNTRLLPVDGQIITI